MSRSDAPLLAVEDLRVSFPTEHGVVRAVAGISFELRRGEALAVVGESGCGKSAAMISILGLTRSAGATISGRVSLDGLELATAPEEQLRQVRGRRIAMTFQDAMSALSPVHRVGKQIVEAIEAHGGESGPAAVEATLTALSDVGARDPEALARSYPHELSGGMRQRALLAMALVNEPEILIADEPTTALDVTTQAQVLSLLARRKQERGLALILVTHDLGIVAEVADRALVMYAGRIVEAGTVEQLFYDPQHPYTWGLLGSIARLDRPRARRLAQIPGQPPSLIAPPAGCHFHPRCPHAFERCSDVPPLEARAGAQHLDRCWLAPERKRELRGLGGDQDVRDPRAKG